LMTTLMKIEADDNKDDGRQHHPTWLEDGPWWRTGAVGQKASQKSNSPSPVQDCKDE
jgi:hypothetical protein